MSWYLSPKNWLIIILLAASIIIGGMYLWQRVTVIKQKGEINMLTEAKKDLEGQVADYKKNVAAMKNLQKEQQKVADDAAKLMREVNKMKATKCLEAKDEKTISDVTNFFNSRGVRNTGDPKTDRKVLPQASAADADRPGWTTKQIIENYLQIIDYALKLENSMKCYEQ
jgi:hypothetical protein